MGPTALPAAPPAPAGVQAQGLKEGSRVFHSHSAIRILKSEIHRCPNSQLALLYSFHSEIGNPKPGTRPDAIGMGVTKGNKSAITQTQTLSL